MNEERVQQQFGAHAEAYATSMVHAKGASLARMVELVQPRTAWTALDVATGAGHTAFAFAPHVSQVTATDITPEMLEVGARLAAEKGLANITFERAAAESLPYAAGSFDLVTCRIAPHHFDSVPAFANEAHRVLKPGGVLAVVDNVVTSGSSDFVNRFEKMRDPSHARCLTLEEWRELFAAQGFTILHTETARKSMEFDDWTVRMAVPAETVAELRSMLIGAQGEVRELLSPRFEGEKIWFDLIEAIIVGSKS